MSSGAILREIFGGPWQLLMVAWPYLLLVLALPAAKLAYRLWEKRRLAASGIEEIDRMDGRTFEKYLEALFERLGYRVELTRFQGDYGGDVVARKEGVKTVIQAKRFKRSVGVKAVQEAVAAKGYYGCEAAMVVTNSRFTRQAVELARANRVTLWDRKRLVEALLSIKESAKPAAAASFMATSPLIGEAGTAPAASTQEEPALSPAEAATDRCVTCGKGVSEKVRAYCTDRPDRFGGCVYCYDHQRTAARSHTAAGAARER